MASPGSVDPTHLGLLIDDDGDFSNASVFDTGSGLTFSYSAGVITISGISTAHIPLNSTRFATVASSDPVTPLPIELVEFQVKCIGDHPNLSWITSSETNNDYFLVESSVNGTHFEEAAHISGAGNSNKEQEYVWIDTRANSRSIYYRLKQVDLDGKTTVYASTRHISCNTIESSVELYPNPSNGDIRLQISNIENEIGILQIIDPLGRIVYKNSLELTKGNNEVALNLSQLLNTGQYYLRINSSSLSYNEILIVR